MCPFARVLGPRLSITAEQEVASDLWPAPHADVASPSLTASILGLFVSPNAPHVHRSKSELQRHERVCGSMPAPDYPKDVAHEVQPESGPSPLCGTRGDQPCGENSHRHGRPLQEIWIHGYFALRMAAACADVGPALGSVSSIFIGHDLHLADIAHPFLRFDLSQFSQGLCLRKVWTSCRHFGEIGGVPARPEGHGASSSKLAAVSFASDADLDPLVPSAP